MAKRGRPPDTARWEEATRLRARGLSLAQIGARLGVSRQGADYLLRRSGGERCRACAAPLTARPLRLRRTAPTYCLACLARRPRAPFAERLRAHRVAAGLRVTELARRAGLSAQAVHYCERGRRRPGPQTLAKLVAVLGPGLLGAEEGK